MSNEERQLLLPRKTVRTNLPDRRAGQISSSVGGRRVGNDQGFGVSPGGQSWSRRISEQPGGMRRIATEQTSPENRRVGSPEVPTSELPVGNQKSGGRGGRKSSRNMSETETDADGQRRLPYHYGSQLSLSGQPRAGQLAEIDPVQEAHYRRYQYYNRLQHQAGVNLDLLNIPDHAVPPSFYQIQFLGVAPSAGKQSSIVTIFAIWNTMMGTSLLSMPWALEQAGLGMGLLMMAFVSGLCLYTAYRILQVYTIHSRTMKISELGDLCGLLLGRWAEYTATIFSVFAILGAAVVYWVLMSNFLFSTVDFIHDNVAGTFNTNESSQGVYCPRNQTTTIGDEIHENQSIASGQTEDKSTYEMIWGQFTTVPFFLILVLFPIINLKSVTLFTKFNSLGTVSIMFILTSVLYRSYTWGFNANFSDPFSEDYIPMIRSSFPSLTGILALGLFIHNAIITIMGNNKYPENNGRDMTLAYMLVTGTYMLIGCAFYVSFPLPKLCIEDNLLNNFHKHDLLTVAAKIFLFFQMMTVFPLIMYLLRVSILFIIFRTVWPGLGPVMMLNSSVIVVCVLFAVFMPQIGTIIRFSGAACGLTIIFALPILVYLASVKRTGELTWSSIIFHSLIIMLGAMNFLAQFFIK